MPKSIRFLPLFISLTGYFSIFCFSTLSGASSYPCPSGSGHFQSSAQSLPSGYFPINGTRCTCEDGSSGKACSGSDSKASSWMTCGDPGQCDDLSAALATSPSKSNKPDASDDVFSACDTAVKTMTKDCDLRANNQTSSVITMGSMLLKTMSTNPALACSQFGDFSTAAQAALLAYDVSCQNDVSDCQSKCDTAGFDPRGANVSDMTVNLRKCNQMAAKEKPDYSVILQAAGMMQMQGTTCVAMKAAISNPACAANPMAPGCAGFSASDCNNPANAGSATCQCISNPAKCSGVGAGTGGNPNGGSPFAGGSRGSTAGGGGPGGGLGDTSISGLGDPSGGSSGGGKGGGGGGGPGGGGLGGGGGGGGAPPNPKKGAMQGKADAKNGSLYGGLLSSNNSGGSTGGSRSASGDGKRVLGGSVIGKPDFNSFRPNMPYDPSRALASKTGGGGVYRDGITGPETNIWEKVKVQYGQQSNRGAFLAQ